MEAVENIRIVLARNLKGRRKDLKINQDELAERSGLSTTYVKNIERGASWPSPESFEALAKGLGISTGELLNEHSEKEAVIIPLKQILAGLSNIPQDVYELIEKVDGDDEAWKTVRAALEIARDRIEKKKKASNN